VRIGTNRFVGDLRRYRITAAIEEISVEIELTSEVRAWRPKSGHLYLASTGGKRCSPGSRRCRKLWRMSGTQSATRNIAPPLGLYRSARPIKGSARRRGRTHTPRVRPASVPLRAPRYAFPSGSATHLVALPDFTRISTVCLPAQLPRATRLFYAVARPAGGRPAESNIGLPNRVW
jgi:hypothetical protein